jgi:hypothetical protein
MTATGLETENDCTGESQQQFIRPNLPTERDKLSSDSGARKIWSLLPWHSEPRTTVMARASGSLPETET